MKMDYPLIILLITIAAAIAAYWSNKENNDQLNRLEKYDTLNNQLSKEIKHLSTLNNLITGRVDVIVSENKALTEHNIILTDKANTLIQEVEKLTLASNELINKINVRAQNTSDENALTGEFDIAYDTPLGDEEILRVIAGTLKTGNPVARFKYPERYPYPPGNVSLDGEHDLIPLSFVNGKLKFSTKIYDLDGDWIADIDNNVWQRNPNNTGRFNYDAKGFEVIDKRGFVALSVDLLTRTDISIHGYLVERRVGGIFVMGEKGQKTISVYAPLVDKIKLLESLQVRQLFEYSGKKWLGKRKNM